MTMLDKKKIRFGNFQFFLETSLNVALFDTKTMLDLKKSILKKVSLKISLNVTLCDTMTLLDLKTINFGILDFFLLKNFSKGPICFKNPKTSSKRNLKK
jgi:hypothetical protein